ncbi:MAG: hypothetical protein IIA87_02380 [Nanoarchaeota archaeon]|nr:hypothetical protein [Nanoarchaeota archaeon]
MQIQLQYRRITSEQDLANARIRDVMEVALGAIRVARVVYEWVINGKYAFIERSNIKPESIVSWRSDKSMLQFDEDGIIRINPVRKNPNRVYIDMKIYRPLFKDYEEKVEMLREARLWERE